MSGKAKKVREKKETTLFLAVIPILAMIVLLGVGYAVMGLKSGGSDAGISSNCRRDRNLSWLYLG